MVIFQTNTYLKQVYIFRLGCYYYKTLFKNMLTLTSHLNLLAVLDEKAITTELIKVNVMQVLLIKLNQVSILLLKVVHMI